METENLRPRTWRLEWDGATYRQNEVTIDLAQELEDTLGMTWLDINPIRSARQAKVILATMASKRTGRPFAEITAEVGAISMDTWLNDVWFLDYEDLPEEFTDGNPPPADAP